MVRSWFGILKVTSSMTLLVFNFTLKQSMYFVLFVQDVYRLRSEHRIVGNFIGCLPSFPRQDQMLGLPYDIE